MRDGTISQFPDNDAWAFVAAVYLFPNPSNPWFEQFPRQINLNNVTSDVTGNNFTAIHIGDVDNSATQGFCEGDLDGDDDVDLADFTIFAGCTAGPDSSYPQGCETADLNGDGNVDLADFAEFQVPFGEMA